MSGSRGRGPRSGLRSSEANASVARTARPFAGLAAELEGDELRQEIERKFAIDLAGRPTMITVRGRSDGRDGRIHTDSVTKLITVLLYMNPVWEAEGGRLRLLRRAVDLTDAHGPGAGADGGGTYHAVYGDVPVVGV